MWKIRAKLETITDHTRKTILDHEAGIEVRRDVIRQRIENFRNDLKGNIIRSIDKAFVTVIDGMERTMTRFASFIGRTIKVNYAIDKENATVVRDWVQ